MYPKKSVYETANGFVTQILLIYLFISLTSVYLFIVGVEGHCCVPLHPATHKNTHHTHTHTHTHTR